MWFAGHLIYYQHLHGKRRNKCLVHEVVILIESGNLDEAYEKSETFGREHLAMIRKAKVNKGSDEIIFGGVRKVVANKIESVDNTLGEFPDEDGEVTHNLFEIESKDREDLIGGNLVRKVFRLNEFELED